MWWKEGRWQFVWEILKLQRHRRILESGDLTRACLRQDRFRFLALGTSFTLHFLPNNTTPTSHSQVTRPKICKEREKKNMATQTPTLALPGQILSSSATTTDPGPGTYIDTSSNTLRASIAGKVHTSKSKPPNQTISISQPHPLTPTLHSQVLCRITRTTPLFATCQILSTPVPFPAQIRTQDIRSTNTPVSPQTAFRVGDIVRATVISLGDEKTYYLSTAGNELGVVMATSEAGNRMFPVSWKEFQDEVTGVREERKVARPV